MWTSIDVIRDPRNVGKIKHLHKWLFFPPPPKSLGKSRTAPHVDCTHIWLMFCGILRIWCTYVDRSCAVPTHTISFTLFLDVLIYKLISYLSWVQNIYLNNVWVEQSLARGTGLDIVILLATFSLLALGRYGGTWAPLDFGDVQSFTDRSSNIHHNFKSCLLLMLTTAAVNLITSTVDLEHMRTVRKERHTKFAAQNKMSRCILLVHNIVLIRKCIPACKNLRVCSFILRGTIFFTVILSLPRLMTKLMPCSWKL